MFGATVRALLTKEKRTGSNGADNDSLVEDHTALNSTNPTITNTFGRPGLSANHLPTTN